MATDLITNGEFATDLTDWVTGLGGAPATWTNSNFVSPPGSAKIQAAAGNPTLLYQEVTTPVGSAREWTIRYSIYNGSNATQPLLVRVWTPAGVYYWSLSHPAATTPKAVWLTFEDSFVMPAAETVYVEFYQAAPDQYWLVDDVALLYMGVDVSSCPDLSLELMHRRHDLGGIKHAEARYHAMVNRAIAEAPRTLWAQDVDTSLTTVAEQRRYSLAALTDITDTRQVLRVLVEGRDDHFYEIGRWRIENAAGVLTLVLDEDPPAADRTMRIEYILPHEALDCTDDTDVTSLDREWLLAKAMTLLLLEADPTLEDANLIGRQLQHWDQVRAGREVEVGRRPAPSKARSAPASRWSR